MLILAVNPGDPFFTRLWDFMGVWHPAIIHLPVACLLVAGMFIVVRWRFPKVSEDVAYYCLLLGAATAVVATVMGFSFAAQKGFVEWWDTSSQKDETMSYHRWAGVVVTGIAVLAAMLSMRDRFKARTGGARPWQLAALLAAAGVGLVGHWGGEMIYGKGYAEKAIAGLFGVDTTHAAAPKGVEPTPGINPVTVGDKVDFVTQIQPILETKCVTCHNADKSKGKLQLQTRELLLKGGKDGPAIVAGSSAKSKIIGLITAEDEADLMPPTDKGGPLGKEQIELIRKWIDQGAVWPDGLVLKERK